MPTSDPTSTRILVYNVVVEWVGRAVNLQPDHVETDRTFQGASPNGYDFNEGRFLQMCDQITVTLISASGRKLRLPGKWRVAHEQDKIAQFINAVAVRLIAAPLNNLGVEAHAWAMKN
jgi:hypothetical protein